MHVHVPIPGGEVFEVNVLNLTDLCLVDALCTCTCILKGTGTGLHKYLYVVTIVCLLPSTVNSLY